MTRTTAASRRWHRARSAAAIDDASRPFASYGIDSLAALTLCAGIEQRYGVDVPLTALLTTLTLAQLQALVEAAPPRFAMPETAAAASGEFALSPGQRELWFESCRAGDDASAWHLAAAFVLDGALDAERFGAALDRLVARHDALRVAIVERDAGPLQCLRAPWSGALARHDASAWSDAALHDWLHAAARRPFDLRHGDGALFAAHLLRRADGAHVLLFVAHHLILDLASAATLLAEWMDSYAALADGREAGVRAARDVVRGGDCRAQCRSGRRRCGARPRLLAHRAGSALPLQDLPLDGVRTAARARRRAPSPSMSASYAAPRCATPLAAFGHDAACAAARGVPGNAASLERRRRTDRRDAQRRQRRVAGRRAARLPRASAARAFDAVARYRLRGAPGAHAQQFCSTRSRIAAARTRRSSTRLRRGDAARPELAHAWFVLQRAANAALGCLLLGATPAVRPAAGGVAWSALPLDARDVAAELSLVLVDDGDTLRATFEFARDVYAPAAVARLADRFVALVDAVLADPAQRAERLPRLAHGERERLLQLARGPERDAPRGTLASRFFAQARRTPDAVALRCARRRGGELWRTCRTRAAHPRTGSARAACVAAIASRWRCRARSTSWSRCSPRSRPTRSTHRSIRRIRRRACARSLPTRAAGAGRRRQRRLAAWRERARTGSRRKHARAACRRRRGDAGDDRRQCAGLFAVHVRLDRQCRKASSARMPRR